MAEAAGVRAKLWVRVEDGAADKVEVGGCTDVADFKKAVKKEFDAAGIEIPFPQRDVHMHGTA